MLHFTLIDFKLGWWWWGGGTLIRGFHPFLESEESIGITCDCVKLNLLFHLLLVLFSC